MNGRKQYISYNNTDSKLCDNSHGIPHGSIFWPLLFLIYVDDMIYCSRILQFVLFADDTNVFLTQKNVNKLFDIVNVELIALSNWFKANKLSINISRTNSMIVYKV